MTGWLRATVLALAVLFEAAADLAAGSGGEPTVRIRVETAPPYAVGRPIALRIEVLAPNYFLSAPSFPTLDIPGAVVKQDDHSLNFTETIGGVTYSGIRTGYTIVPQQPGPIALPQPVIDFTYAAVPGQSAPASVTMPPQRFEVAAAAGGAPVAEYSIDQSLDRDPAKLKAGDALNRTITIRRPDAPAMTIPPPRIDTPDGVNLYRHDPALSDQPEGGQRMETVTYVFPHAGRYVLPPISAGAARAPEVRVHVAAAFAGPAIAPEAARGLARLDEVDWGFWLPRFGGALAAAMLAVLVWRRWGRTVRDVALAWRVRRGLSEPACFSRLAAACRDADDAAAYRSLLLWSGRAGIRPLDGWVLRFGGAELQAELRRLESHLFAAPAEAGWNTRPLGLALAAARRRWRAAAAQTAGRALPDLN